MNEIPKSLSEKDAIALFLAGKPVAMGEYRSSEAETIQYRDRETGRAASFPQLRHIVELGNKSVVVSERVGDGFNSAEYKSPFRKGQRVVVEITSLEVQRGMISVRGMLLPISAQ